MQIANEELRPDVVRLIVRSAFKGLQCSADIVTQRKRALLARQRCSFTTLPHIVHPRDADLCSFLMLLAAEQRLSWTGIAGFQRIGSGNLRLASIRLRG